MEEFVYLIRPTREGFLDEMTPEEEDVMGRHFEYLQGLLAEQKLVLAGPCLDRVFGVVVFKAASLEEARELMEGDPSVAEGVMSAELHPFRVSLLKA